MNEIETTENDVLAGKYLTFKLSSEEYGIEILKIREIIGVIPITRVPKMPHYIKGVINLRGKVIPVIDLRLKFGIEPEEYTKLTCIIVVQIECKQDQFLIGVAVDTVNEVMYFSDQSLEPPPAYGGSLKTDFIKAMGKLNGSVKILLDIDKIITSEDITCLRESAV